ncbi:hypothetical protein RclHR1_01680023 [Rhizophagus clarus]|uniref:Uncharacterized protein n=1 Tax=Rhizophagus clarus TaxID=94130 RepID=A0A2Z6QMK2_9GLOM|nr:hypothetical protein RclHR1_01680023 [Rhizophagus clarus]GES83772.1 hypothetical protein GLOIN_2v1781383 [Rhizophagus clarus]
MFKHIRLFGYSGLRKYSTFQPPRNLGILRNEIEFLNRGLRDRLECANQDLRKQVNFMEQILREENKSIGQDLRKEVEQTLREFMKKEFENSKNELNFQNLKNKLKIIKAKAIIVGKSTLYAMVFGLGPYYTIVVSHDVCEGSSKLWKNFKKNGDLLKV